MLNFLQSIVLLFSLVAWEAQGFLKLHVQNTSKLKLLCMVLVVECMTIFFWERSHRYVAGHFVPWVHLQPNVN